MFNTGIAIRICFLRDNANDIFLNAMGPLQDAISTEKILLDSNEGETENKAVTSFKKLISFLFNDPLRCLQPSNVFFVPCDHILQRTH